MPPDASTGIEPWKRYAERFDRYQRLRTHEVRIGEVALGGDNPIRIQSMTTTDTLDTLGTVEQSIRMIEAGCELVRITAPSKKEAENLANIKAELRKRGYNTPLVADIHFTPNAAEIAARIVEKVRVNPGNYADKKKFQQIEYTDADYQAELDRIAARFTPLVKLCKEHGTAMRIGTNHGSLSDRIMSRYGDTPEGMVASALEFLDICEAHSYDQVVISMKASNTRVMVAAYRLLVQRMLERGVVYPLHLGVTEAGDGEDGRIKSAVGIGTLLLDGIGDTIRVSLTEAPEAEMPIGRYIRDHYIGRSTDPEAAQPLPAFPINPYGFQRRQTRELLNIGGSNDPRVITDLSHHGPTHPLQPNHLAAAGHTYTPSLDKWEMTELGTDYVALGNQAPDFMFPNGLRGVLHHHTWARLEDTAHEARANKYPFYPSLAAFLGANQHHPALNYVALTAADWQHPDLQATLEKHPIALVLPQAAAAPERTWRQQVFQLMAWGVDNPVLLQYTPQPDDSQVDNRPDHRFQTTAACQAAQLCIDGLVDGIWLQSPDVATYPVELLNRTAFGILQAARLRMTRTEYISCPSCGRTLFDLEETTARIRKVTDHLSGVKIGIMGCIVNGPGEMADADYGYVGSGPGVITLYRGQEVVRRNVPTAEAVDALIAIIDEDGNWVARKTESL